MSSRAMNGPIDEIGALVGRALGDRYAIERALGEGGMAYVFLARDVRIGRQVALKVLRQPADLRDTTRFRAEINVTARLQHPNIQVLHDYGEVEGLTWYAMPYVEGETLRQRIVGHNALGAVEAFQIAREVAEALAYAHEKGLVHRDIKPENILLSHGHAIVADFGIVKAITPEGVNMLTGEGCVFEAVIGSLPYMSPEQTTCGELDGRSDVYSLGCVLYEMLTGRPPFHAPTVQAMMLRRMTEPPPRPSAAKSGLPRQADVIVTKAMATHPADRFSTAALFAEALAGRGLPLRSRWARLFGTG